MIWLARYMPRVTLSIPSKDTTIKMDEKPLRKSLDGTLDKQPTLRSLAATSYFIFGLALWHPQVVTAATVERYSDPVMGCSILLSGFITEGDSIKLAELAQEMNEEGSFRHRICFNSPGGSFVEGVRLAQTIQETMGLGSAIADGHICESACAIAFMAGGWAGGEEDDRSVKPIMHPHSRLGFHAPSIEVQTGQYTELQVKKAWNVAIQAVSEIVNMQKTINYIPANLFFAMLSTSPDSMFYIDTVEKAILYDIAIFPVGLNFASSRRAFENLCNLNSEIPDYSSRPIPTPNIRNPSPNEIEAFFNDRFGSEATESCRVQLNFESMQSKFGYYYPGGPIQVIIGGDQNGRGEYIRQSSAYPYMTFDRSLTLQSLPIDIKKTWKKFIAQAQITDVSAQECWLKSENAKIVNVDSFVNLRSQPNFSSAIIREVPVGERVVVQDIQYIRSSGSKIQRNNCDNACQSFNSNPQNVDVRDRAQQCINDNVMWSQIKDATGRIGWVSRKFLKEVQ